MKTSFTIAKNGFGVDGERKLERGCRLGKSRRGKKGAFCQRVALKRSALRYILGEGYAVEI
jgi:hypothetical protein